MIWATIRWQHVPLGQLLIEHVWNVSLAKTGTTCIGGLISPIAYYVEIDTSRMVRLPGPKLLNMPTMVASRMIRMRVNGIWFIESDT